MVTTFVAESGEVSVPFWVTTIDAFRDWLDSEELPEKFKPWFLKGQVWVDMCLEQLDSHLKVKGEITSTLWMLVKSAKLGSIYPDGVHLTNHEADISGNPDMLFISNQTLSDGSIRRVEGAEEGHVELEGTPDMVLEVVSKSSVKKDTEILFEAYWEAGIGEYWLVDARSDAIAFDIYKRGPKGFVATRKQAGWLKSVAFGKSFKLTRENDEQGNPEFTLHVK